MLIDDPDVLRPDQILSIMAKMGGRRYAVRLREGVYEVGHYGSSGWLPNYEHFTEDLSIGNYGVCDTVEQLLAACPELEASDRQFVVTVIPVRKSEQEPGGWRWRKWGDYIGTQNPQCEHLRDEPEIEEVLCYHIYERKA